MPTPARTSLHEIISAGRALIESGGPETLTMNGVAAAVGVKPPSLYKHVPGRAELIRLIAEDVIADLSRWLEDVATGDDPKRDLVSLAHVFRRFAHTNPSAYGLVFGAVPEEWRPDPERLQHAADPVVRTTTALVGPDRALDAARTVTAWAHGFVSMELAGAFRMGGDVDAAFLFGIERISGSLTDG